MNDVIVIGAGVAGLACARALTEAGRQVLVVERARGVGGRCASRHVEGHPVDLGPVFLHGDDPAFLAAVGGVPGAVAGWPRHVDGVGAPCQPDALQAHQTRFTYEVGLSAFPRHLAAGLTVQLVTTVVAVETAPQTLLVRTSDDAVLEARDVVIALPVEQGLQLLTGLSATVAPASLDHRQVAGACAVLSLCRSVPCLTLVAGYDDVDAGVPWDVQYPDTTDCLQLIANDTSKRGAGAAGPRVLVFQARPRWSRLRMDLPEAVWTAELLVEAAARLGAWAGSPRFTHAHRWRYARVERGTELQQPLRLTLAGGQRVGIAGDVFAPGGGVQAAWLSGTRLAHRLLEELP